MAKKSVKTPKKYVELPIKEQRELKKEFFLEEFARSKFLDIVSIVMAFLLVVIVLLSLLVENWILFFAVIPIVLIVVILVHNEKKFGKWLKDEKNIEK